MKKIAYYISDYGFGHATRSLAIIQELLRQSHEVEVTICHTYAKDLLVSTLKESSQVKFRFAQTDIGYFLKEDTIQPDIKKLISEYNYYMEKWSDFIDREKHFLMKENIDLVISDISPIAFEAAYQADIMSIGISNFTWYTAYQSLIDEVDLQALVKAYNKMTYFFTLAGSNEPTWSRHVINFNFFSRDIDNDEVNRIRDKLNPNGNKILIYFGLGMKIDVKSLHSLPLWDSPNSVFITSSNTMVNKPNVYQIPSDYTETHNMIAATDLAISKAGWGTVSEAVNGATPLLIIERGCMKEDQNTTNFILHHKLGQKISWEQLQSTKITDEFMKVLKSNYIPYKMPDEKNRIAGKILNILYGESSGFLCN